MAWAEREETEPTRRVYLLWSALKRPVGSGPVRLFIDQQWLEVMAAARDWLGVG